MKLHSKPGLLKMLFGGGRQAPARAKLPLYIPVVSKPDKLSLDVESLVEELLRHDYAPITLFAETARLLEKINPLALPAEQRYRVTNILLSEANAALSALLPRFLEQGSGVPETREQREGISHGVRAGELLAISYKLVFQSDYAHLSDDFSKRERLITATLRIMELIRLEQLLRAFRYQQLPQHGWRDCNQLFFSARCFADVRAVHPLRLRVFNSLVLPPRDLFPELGSIEQVFLSIQITGLLDVISWPTHLMYVIDGYLGEMDPPLGAQRDHEEELVPGQVVIYRNQGIPPRFEHSQDELGDAVRVDLRPLIDHAAADRRLLNGGNGAAGLSQSIQQLGEHERVPVLDLILHKINPQHRREPRRAVFEVRDARVYGGFEGIYRFMHGQVAHEKRREDPFWNSLASHPQIITGNDNGRPPRWIVANESEGGVQFRLQENQYAMPLHVGRLMAYTLGSGDHVKLGYITRLQRVGEHEVEVAITRLRETIAAVVVEVLESSDQHTLPALLVREPNGKLQLLCEYKHGVATGSHISIIANGHSYTGVVDKICLKKPEFVIFRLHTSE